MQLRLATQLQEAIIESTCDGEGIRLVLFTAYCPHHCLGCHNQQLWSRTSGVTYEVEQVVRSLLQRLEGGPYSGITISGGDPLAQSTAIKSLLQTLKQEQPTLNIWCYTGYRLENLPDPSLLPFLDVLVDGPFQKEHCPTTLPFRGSSNQRMIRLQAGKVISFE